MKINMDLCRLILIELEKSQKTEIPDLVINGYEKDEIVYNCTLLEREELITHINVHYSEGEIYFYYVGSLTLQGKEFLRRISDDKLWEKIKKKVLEITAIVTIEIIKNVVFNKLTCDNNIF